MLVAITCWLETRKNREHNSQPPLIKLHVLTVCYTVLLLMEKKQLILFGIALKIHTLEMQIKEIINYNF